MIIPRREKLLTDIGDDCTNSDFLGDAIDSINQREFACVDPPPEEYDQPVEI